MQAINTATRAQKSMRQELYEILTRRCMAYSLNPNGKALSFTLRYHLANLMYELASDHHQGWGTYEANKLEILKNNLHKQLL